MRTRTILIAILLLATVAVPPTATAMPKSSENCSFPVSKADATGTTVSLDTEPKRVVTLSPSAAQIMWEIGARDKVVGMTQYASYLEGADEKANVSSSGQSLVNVEKVVSLRPDLVLAPNSVPKQIVDKLRNAGLTVYYYRDATSIEDVYRDTTVTGHLAGACGGAQKTVSWMKKRINSVRQAVPDQERPDVLYLFYGYTAGEGTFIDEIIRSAGGNNVAAEVGISGYRKINKEVVVKQNPEWIVLNDNDPAVPDSTEYENLTAVRKNQTVVVPIEYMNQPAPRVVYAITNLTKQFYPDAYSATSTTIPRTTTETKTTTESEETATESPGQPGFGTTSVVVALLCALQLVRRWY